jgi:hypothetical protein
MAPLVASLVDRTAPLYIATDVPAPDRAQALAPFAALFGRLHLSHDGTLGEALAQAPSNDWVGCVEVEVCARAAFFFASSSTLSASVLNARHGLTGVMDEEVDWTRNRKLIRMARGLDP